MTDTTSHHRNDPIDALATDSSARTFVSRVFTGQTTWAQFGSELSRLEASYGDDPSQLQERLGVSDAQFACYLADRDSLATMIIDMIAGEAIDHFIRRCRMYGIDVTTKRREQTWKDGLDNPSLTVMSINRLTPEPSSPTMLAARELHRQNFESIIGCVRDAVAS